jgi:integrase/recombinase XerD
MLTNKITLDTRRIRKDGTYPLIVRFSYLGKTKDIPLQIFLLEQDWDKSKGVLLKSAKDYITIYKQIMERHTLILSKMVEFQKNNSGYIDLTELKKFIDNKQSIAITFKSYWEQEIKRLYLEKRDGNAFANNTALSVIDKISSLAIPIDKVNYSYLKNIESKLLQRGCKVNTIAVYFRALRAIYNSAIKEKMVNRESYPFYDYKIKKEKTIPRPILLNEVQEVFNLTPEENTVIWHHLNYCKMMFYLRGINYKDLILLTKDNYRNGRIIYTRSKTKKVYSIEVLEPLKQLLSLYYNEERKTLLPVLTNSDLEKGETLFTTIQQKRKTLNKYLDTLGKKANLEIKLTSYVMRYSWANIAKSLGYSKDLISEGLGHEYGNRVTGIYLENFDLSELDSMNRDICSRLLNEVEA